MKDISDQSAVSEVDFGLLGSPLGAAVEASLSRALARGVRFGTGNDPLAVFRAGLASSIHEIESARGRLLQRFLTEGPYERRGPIPPELASLRLSDEEAAAAVSFIYSFMVNAFQGCLAEFLALEATLDLLGRLQERGDLPSSACLFATDAVRMRRLRGQGFAKGADFTILSSTGSDVAAYTTVLAAVEVKSYRPSRTALRRQMQQHLRRAALGLEILGELYGPDRVRFAPRPLQVLVVPSRWRLPRAFRFERKDRGRILAIDPPTLPRPDDEREALADSTWLITLRYSKELLAAVAYEVTFWYMEKLGEAIYAGGVPKVWAHMTPAEAGKNAVKMMLYYAIPRAQSLREEGRAIALYNTYGFGYALGMNFRNRDGYREMLWPEDLDEIAALGRTKNGWRIC